MTAPLLTIGIPCKDRPIELAILLQSLLEQSLQSFDIILVNDSIEGTYLEDGKVNHTIAGLLYLHKNSGNSVKIVQKKRRGEGPHVAGEIILQQATTKYILRLDDDVTLVPGYVEALLSVLESDEKIAACGGVWINPFEDPKRQVLPDAIDEASGNIRKQANGTFEFNSRVQWGYYKNREDTLEVEHLNSGFMYRREVGLAIGGYPKDLSPVGHNEETDFSYRMFRAGHKLCVVPKAVGFHFHPPYGGIRENIIDGEYSKIPESMWISDAEKFQKKLKYWSESSKVEEVKEESLESAKDFPPLDIIILTYSANDPFEVLESIFCYTEPPYRVIIVNNDVKPLKTDLSFTPSGVKTQVINTGKALPVSTARNIGAKAAGDYFCFMDDDARIIFDHRIWLRRLYDVFVSEPDIGAVGPVVTKEPETGYKVISSCCLFTSKKVFEVVGGFDPVFGNPQKGTWGFEDTDWSIRCTQAGFRILPITGTFPFYHQDPDLSDDPVKLNRADAKAKAHELFRAKWSL